MQLRAPDATKVAAALKERLGDDYDKAWLFFRLAEATVKTMLVAQHRGSHTLQFLFGDDEIDDALLELEAKGGQSTADVKSGTLILEADGSFDSEFGYDDKFSRSLEEYFHELQHEHFSGREILPAEFDSD